MERKTSTMFWVDLRGSTAANLIARVRHRKRVAIGPVVQHGIESLVDGDDSCPERNLFTAHATWIARTIEELMVGEDDTGIQRVSRGFFRRFLS